MKTVKTILAYVLSFIFLLIFVIGIGAADSSIFWSVVLMGVGVLGMYITFKLFGDVMNC